MSTATDTHPTLPTDVSSDEAILVEYLDGELSVRERQIVEQRLGREPELRETLTRLEESWKFLDLLEREDTDKELVETTLEVLVLQAEQSVAEKQAERGKRFSVKKILFAAFFLFLFCFAFVAGERLGDKDFLLRVASPIIERRDMYRPLLDEDPDLLRLLTERRLFLPPLPPGSPPVDPKEYLPSPSVYVLDSFTMRPSFEELERRVRRIRNFDESLYNRFYTNYQIFKDLSWEKKHRLREMHEEIVQSPRRDEIFQTLQNYHNWRKSLQSYEKAELRKPLSAEERVEQIAELKHRLDAHRTDTEVAPLISDVVRKNEGKRLAETLKELPAIDREHLLDATPDQIIRVLVQYADRQPR